MWGKSVTDCVLFKIKYNHFMFIFNFRKGIIFCVFIRRTNQTQGEIHQGSHSSRCKTDFDWPFHRLLYDHENSGWNRSSASCTMLSVISNHWENGSVTKGSSCHAYAQISSLAGNRNSSWCILFISLCPIQAAFVVFQWPENPRVCVQCFHEPVWSLLCQQCDVHG